MDNNNNNNGGIGITFGGILTIVFIVLKLTGFIKWSWLWVLAPLWIEFLIVAVLIVIAIILAVIEKNDKIWK